MSDGTTLVLLTGSYPFGLRNESFLENEVPILAERFDQVLVLPSHRKSGRRELPKGVELVEMQWLDGWDRRSRLRAIADRDALGVLRSIVDEPRDWIAYARGVRGYVDVLGQNLLKSRELRAFIQRRRLEEALYYDYWFENSTLALAILRAAGEIPVAVARAHRFDLYDEEWPASRVPFRKFKARHLDRIYPVSEYGRDYLTARVPWAADRIEVQRLGVGRRSPPCGQPSDLPLVVSCGTFLRRKRYHLVPAVLERLGRQVRWIHFGNGPDASRVRAAAERLPDRVSWELRGDVANHEVLRFYETHPVDVFLSLSISEGVPVSMMEAISFGIPVVGIGVHGVPEVVTPQTGICLSADATPQEAAWALAEALTPGRLDRDAVRSFFVENYEASRNYTRFADGLLALRSASLQSTSRPGRRASH